MIQRVYSRRRRQTATQTASGPGGIGAITGAGPGGAWNSQTKPSPGGFNQLPTTPAFNATGPTPINPVAAPSPTAPVTGWQSALPDPIGAATSFLNPHAQALKGFAGTRRDNAYADISQQAGYGQADYGYTGQDTNGDGIPDAGFQVDPANPFSKAALLQRAYDQRTQGTTNQMAAGGQLYSGALQRMQNENAFQNDQAVNANMRDFSRLMEALSRGRRDAGQAATEDVADIDWQALLAAIGGNGAR